MIKELEQLIDLDHEGELSSLKPASDSDVVTIAALYPGISKRYLEFIREVGTGSTTRGFNIYEPEPARLIEQHSSFQIYQSDFHRKLFGRRPDGDVIPADAITIADTGASWRYCLCPSFGEAVFCLDMAGPTFETVSESFLSFVADTVLLNGLK
ncbi:hypothetical protein AU381_14885 [Sinorhizobium glycinis]|uniref:Knr4/Smi1-like domain-containing protein n=1 Tax=Sinorhizobium glycinis TaxID=1472378 RepID=A0A178Y4J7_9HYPH|nr:SMI1/KNR4 family protein [Sinorhizobium glycinis]OAP42478.1 hypothetical protein AU381_14885 [Sinorhizobium glycinis]